jgi:hypothetical protein
MGQPGRRALSLAVAISTACVVARSLVFILYEQSFFDSDQAIIGLMAKHLAEGRALPLFFYGQSYLLGLDAWFAAPFFLVFGPSVAALHGAMVVLNVVVAGLLVVGLVRWGGLAPAEAAAATVFFSFAPPLTGALLIEAGAIVTFLAVLLLWILRERPLGFGIVLALGVLYREFTIYAPVILLIGDVWSRRLWTPARIRTWAIAGLVALATVQGVQALRPYADLMGPGTPGQLTGGLDRPTVGNVLARVSIRPREFPTRAAAMARDYLPGLLGGRYIDRPVAKQGRDELFWVLAIGLTGMLVRALLQARREGFERTAFGWYLIGLGLASAAGYVATRPTTDIPTERYFLLAVLLPVGIVGVSWALNRSQFWKGAAVVVLGVWTIVSAVDHVRQGHRYWSGSEPNDIRLLADALVARDIEVAEAGYWRAYKVAFLANERVRIASTDVARITEYQRLAEAAGDDLVRISDEPCEGGEVVGPWMLCRD